MSLASRYSSSCLPRKELSFLTALHCSSMAFSRPIFRFSTILLSIFISASVIISLVLLTSSAPKGRIPSISTTKSKGTSRMNISDRLCFFMIYSLISDGSFYICCYSLYQLLFFSVCYCFLCMLLHAISHSNIFSIAIPRHPILLHLPAPAAPAQRNHTNSQRPRP